MSISKLKVSSFIRYSLAHHPICWQFRDHIINIKGIRLCLGCTGFYTGFFLGLLVGYIWLVDRLAWLYFIMFALFLWIPTIFRLMNVPFFTTTNRRLRFLFRWLLGIGIGIGVISILVAPSVGFQVLQVIIGLLFYIGMTIKRVKGGLRDWDALCNTCTFTRNLNCPGMGPLLAWRH